MNFSLSFLKVELVLPSRVCVRLCVRLHVNGRSTCLVALAEGPCSDLNPPPALPACTSGKREVCLYATVCVSPGRPGSSAGCSDSCRQQQAAGPGPPSGLPLPGTSCVCGPQPHVSHCMLYLSSVRLFLRSAALVHLAQCPL